MPAAGSAGQGKARRVARAAASSAAEAGVAAASEAKVGAGGREEEGEAADGPGSPWWRSPMAAAPRAASRASKRGGAGTSSRWAAAVDAARAGAGEGWGGGGEVREEKERSHEGFWWRARFRPAHQATAGH